MTVNERRWLRLVLRVLDVAFVALAVLAVIIIGLAVVGLGVWKGER